MTSKESNSQFSSDIDGVGQNKLGLRPVVSKQIWLFLLTVMAAIGIVGWFIWTGEVSSWGKTWLSSMPNWILVRGVRELLITGILLWLGTRQGSSHWLAMIVLLICSIGMIAAQQMQLFSYAELGDLWVFWLIYTATESCEWYWMYVGIVCASVWYRFVLVPSFKTQKLRNLEGFRMLGRKRVKALVRTGLICSSCLFAYAFVDLTLSVRNSRQMTVGVWNITRVLAAQPITRWLLGFCFVGVLLSFGGRKDARLRGVSILGFGCLLVAVLSYLMRDWGSHYFFTRAMLSQNVTFALLVGIPMSLALSPIAGYMIAIPVFRLFGLRFAFYDTAGLADLGRDHMGDTIESDGAEDPNDSEMYL